MSDALSRQPAARGTTMLLWMIPVASIALVTLLFGAPRDIQLATAVLLLLGTFGFLFWRWPGVTIAMMPVFIIPPQFLKVFAYELMLIAAALGLVLIGWRRRAAWLTRLDSFEIMVWLLLAWATFTVFWCRDTWWWLFGVRKMLMGALALWVAMRMVRFVNPDLLLVGIPAGACALSLATIFRAVGAGGTEAIAAHHGRASGTDLGWGQANFIAALLALMLPTGIYIATTGRRVLHRVIGWASIPLTASVVTIAASRGGALLVVAVALFGIFRSRIKPWMAITTAVVMIALLLTGPGATLLMERFSSPEDIASIVIRFMFFRVAWARVVDHWPLGMGLGQGLNYQDRLADEDPHNYWLVLGSELGAVGLVLWIAILVMLWVRISRIERNRVTQPEGRALQLTFGIAMLNLMFEPTFQGLQYHALFYWVIGAYLGREQVRAENSAALSAVPSAPSGT